MPTLVGWATLCYWFKVDVNLEILLVKKGEKNMKLALKML
jgi:hypothetical protein